MSQMADVPSPNWSQSAWVKHGVTVLQVLVTAGLLWWIFHDAGRREQMRIALAEADWRWMVAAFVAAGVCEFFGILRWHLFLRMLKTPVRLREVTGLFFIGAFFNQFLPGTTGGDVVRVLYLMKDRPRSKTAGFLSVAVDRLLAVLALVILGLAFAWARSSWFAQSFAIGHLMKWFAIMLFIMLLALVVSFALTNRRLILRLPKKIPFRRQLIKWAALWQLCLENRRDALLGAFYTLPMLFAYFFAFAFAARAFSGAIRIWDVVSIMPLVTAISSLPVSLNGIGVREALFDGLLVELCGLPQGKGALISLAGMFVYLLWGLVGAFYYAARLRRNFSGARERAGADSPSTR